MSADRHLLFGLLALQNEFIDKKQLVAAFGLWIADHSKPLDEILIQLQAIREDDRGLLARLVDRHVAANGGNVEASLRSFKGDASIRDELDRLADGEVKHSVAKLRPVEMNTMIPARGQETSTGRRFEIRRPLDRGGLGVVSVALDNELNREVALKEIRSDCADEPAYRAKFMLEAEVTGGLEHPGIVPVYGFGTGPDGRPFYAMRLIKGDNLHAHIKRFHQSVNERTEPFDGAVLRGLLRRFLDVCEAIDYAHARGVLHRDLKPGNIMLGKYGETLVVDWGLAKPQGAERSNVSLIEDTSEMEPSLIPSGSHEGLTLHGSVVGTAAYAPPEQLSGRLEFVNERSDIYGLGAILYEILTNQPPAKADSLEAVMRIAISGAFKRPRLIEPQIPKPLDAVCARALATNPQERYPSAGMLRKEIERWLDDLPVDAYREPILTRGVRWLKRHQVTAAAVSGIVLMSTLGLGLLSYVTRRNNATLSIINTELNEQRDVAHQYRSDAINRYAIAKEAIDTTLLGMSENLGRLPGADRLQKELLDRAAADFERLSKIESNDPELELERVRALVRLADIYHLQNLLVAAHDKYEEALDVADQSVNTLAAEASKEVRLNLAIERGKIHSRIGLAYDIENKLDEAARDFEKADKILKQLAEEHPDSEACRMSLANMLIGKAAMFERKWGPERALPIFQESLSLFEKLSSETFNDFAAGMARCQEGLGRIYRRLGRFDEARQALIASRETTSKRLIDGKNVNLQLDLASLAISKANLERTLGGWSAALKELEASTAIYETLRREYPTDAQIKEVWAMNEVDIGATLIDLGMPSQAKEHAFPAVQAFDELVTAFPGIPSYRNGQALALDVVAQALMEQESPSENIELAYKRSLALVDDLVQPFSVEDSAADPYRILAIGIRIHLAKYFQIAERLDESKSTLVQAVNECERLLKKQPTNQELKNLLAYAVFRQALCSSSSPDALPYFAQSIKLRRELHATAPTADTAYQLAFAQLRSFDPALIDSAELLQVMKKAREYAVQNFAHDNLVAEAHLLAGDKSTCRQVLETIKSDRGSWMPTIIVCSLGSNKRKVRLIKPSNRSRPLELGKTPTDPSISTLSELSS